MFIKHTFNHFFILCLLAGCSEKVKKAEPYDAYCGALKEVLPHDVRIEANLSHNFAKPAINYVKQNIPKYISTKATLNPYVTNSLKYKSLDFEFFINEIPMCLNNLTTYTSNKQLTLAGSLPENKTKKIISFYKKDISYLEIKEKIRKNFKENIKIKIRIRKKSLCYFEAKNSIILSQDIKAFINNKLYHIILTKDKINYIASLSHSILTDVSSITQKIKATVYETTEFNKPILKTVTTAPMSKSGSLCSQYFTILTEAPKLIKKDGDFSTFKNGLPMKDFEQLSLFVNSNLHKDWFLSLDSVNKWLGPQIEININSGDDKNTAYFTPGDSYFKSRIELGPGDNIKLKDLLIMPAAVQHEVAHHIIYYRVKQYLKGSESQSLHEGIADIFVMLHHQNPCFGKNLCITNQSPCDANKCLRNAENNYTYKTNPPPLSILKNTRIKSGHIWGQLISGLLWSLLDKGMSNKELANLTYQATMLLSKNATFNEFIAALFNAEKELYNSRYCTILKESVISKQFDDAIKNIQINC